MMSRLISPLRTASSLAAITSICQIQWNCAFGLSSWKQRERRVAKSRGSGTSYSPLEKFSGMVPSPRLRKPLANLLHHLLVSLFEHLGHAWGILASFNLLQQGDHHLDRLEIGSC